MKPAYRLLSVMLLSLPLVSVALVYDRLPLRLPVHFDADDQPDLFNNRSQWMSRLIITMFLLNIGRSVLMRVVERQRTCQRAQLEALYLLTAVSVAGIVSLLALEGGLGKPLFADWFPVWFFLSGSGVLYVSVSPHLPVSLLNTDQLTPPQLRRLAAMQQFRSLSHWIVVRVNLAAAVLMLFVGRHDRWQLGLLANLLAYSALMILAEVNRRRSG